MGHRQRRETFRKVWFFDCTCVRCSDATEMGSYLNGLACQLCKRGTVLPHDPLDYDTRWKCDQENCDFSLSTDQVEQIETAAEKKTEYSLKDSKSSDWIEFYESLLAELSPQFHPHHYLLMKVKSQLISQYGNVVPYAKLPTVLVRRKWELCQEFLDVFGAVDPGTHTDWWAMTQLEWIESRVVLLQRDLDSGKIPTVEDFKTALITQCRKTLPDVTSVLELEQTTTYCHQMAKKAKRLMQEMDDLIRFADFL